MESSVTNDAPPPKKSRMWLLFSAILAVIVGVNVTLNFTAASQGGAKADAGGDIVAASLYTKIAVFLRASDVSIPGADPAKDQADEALRLLRETEKGGAPKDRAKALRREAILLSFLDLPGAEDALASLGTIPAEDRAPAPEDEAALLREILITPELSPERARELSPRLGEIPMGYFDHLLEERLYRRAGLTEEADAALTTARGWAGISVAAMAVFGTAMSLGAILWLVFLLSSTRTKVFRKVRDHLRAKGELTEGQALAFFATFVFYMGVTVGVWLLVRRLPLLSSMGLFGRTLSVVVVELLIALLAYGFFRIVAGKEGATLGTLGWKRGAVLRDIGVGIVGYLLLLPAIVVVLLPLSTLFEKLGIPSQGHPIVEQIQQGTDDPPVLVLLFFVAAVAAPLLEESLFRGALYGALKTRMKGGYALLLAGFLFAIVHPQVGLGLVGVFVIGMAVNLVYEYTGSLVASATVHALNNGVLLAVAVALFGG